MSDTKILTDDELTAIEIAFKRGDDNIHLYIPALCATISALRAEQIEGETCEFCDHPTNDEKGNPLTFLVCGRCWNANAETNRKTITELRDQLTVMTEERDIANSLADRLARGYM